ncbi:coilin [Phlebotomus argentipes]|uniref:coilin n=1 Tax=Phlebotomus argentipes TaxID=94469 RepID=UPI0028936288|nr:coilin [Phlebotomus argentipes]
METGKRSFPLKVNLADFFSDHRQKAYICVKEKWTCVRDLQEHIVELFSLCHDVFLRDADGYLFPAQEPIDIIPRDGSVLNVERQENDCQRPVDDRAKAFKSTRNSTPFANGIPRENEWEITETPIEGIPLPKENGAVLPEVRDKEKKTRKRVRKRKKNNYDYQEDSSSLQDDAVENHKKLKSKTLSHIRFQEEEGSSDKLHITDTPLGQSDVIVSRTLHKTNEKESNGKQSLNRANETNSFALEELRERLPNMELPVLKKLPKKDDVIAFKLLKMSETYEPALSAFIIGIVECVCKEKGEVSLLILSGEEELKQPEGKFSLPETAVENEDDNLDDDLLTVKFSNLHEVRRLDLAKLGATM